MGNDVDDIIQHCLFFYKLTVHVVLLPIPPQAHGNKSQQDEDHH